ncbi:helix-turn-helix domain-containing protein [Salmonella enterica]|nr:helix-turn-helix domain-containing protein [Salmonella enterica]EAX3608022.1 helix-turn-helix domain-containing protein [Salmonella enterica]EGW6281702.1 helix-turn-helix domain-containing protein [Salmonella enterica]EGX3934232.1 helix-turn-helix domain-containing protein [Salmonella enterica]
MRKFEDVTVIQTESSDYTDNKLNTDVEREIITADIVIYGDRVVKNRLESIPGTIGFRINLARKNSGMSEAKLAAATGLTDVKTIQELELSDYEPCASEIIRLAQALRCDPLWLLTGEELTTDEAYAIGKRLNQRRFDLGITMAELAAVLNVSEGTIWNWETGREKLPHYHTDQIAKELDTSVTWILTGKDIAKES